MSNQFVEDHPPSLPISDPTYASREQNLAQQPHQQDDDDHGDSDYNHSEFEPNEEINQQQHVSPPFPSAPASSSFSSSKIQTSAQEPKASNTISSSSVEPSSNSSFRRINHTNNNNNNNSNSLNANSNRLLHPVSAATTQQQQQQPQQLLTSSVSPQRPNKPLFGVDPIGRLLSFNTSTNNTTSDDNSSAVDTSPSDANNTSDVKIVNTPDGAASDASIIIGGDSPQSTNVQQSKQQRIEEEKPVVVSVANRRRMAAALRVPLNQQQKYAGNSSLAPTPSNIEAYQNYSILDDINNTNYNDDDDDDHDDSSFRSMSNRSAQQQQHYQQQPFSAKNHSAVTFSPSSIIGDLPSYQSPIRGGDGGMSLVTVLEEYNVLRNCRGWLQETQTRTLHSLDSQGDQLVDWQRRRLEQQSEGVLDDLAGTLNPTTIAEMYDAIAGCLDQVEHVLEPAFQARLTELTTLKPIYNQQQQQQNNNNGDSEADHHHETSFGVGAKALSSYVHLVSLEADRILDLSSNIHVSLDSIKADLTEARSADTAFDLDRRQSRRNFVQKISILEDECRQLKFDLRREMKVCLDRDRKSKKKFDVVHGQLEALLKGVQLFDDVREDIADAAEFLEEIVSHSIKLRMNHNHEVTSAQRGRHQGDDTTIANNSDLRHHQNHHYNNDAAEMEVGAPSPNSKEGIQFYQRVAAISRKLKDHGFDLAAMMSPSAATSKAPKIYQQTNTACFVDPSIVFATQDAKDLGAIEDIADEYFAPMAMEAYDQRRDRSSSVNSNNDEQRHHDYDHDHPRRAVINDRLNRINNNNNNSNDKNKKPSSTASSLSSPAFATPPVPAVLSAKSAMIDHLDNEARRQAAEILEEAKRRTDAAKDFLNEARRKAAVATGVPLSAYSPQKDYYLSPFIDPKSSNSQLENETAERPRLPSVAIPDSKVDLARITPNSPEQQQQQPAASTSSAQSATKLHDLVPAPLRGFLPRDQDLQQNQPQRDEDIPSDENARNQQTQDVNPTPVATRQDEEAKPPNDNSKNSSNDIPLSYQNPKRPRKNSLLSTSTAPMNRPVGGLPLSVSYKVGMPFGTRGTLGGEESTIPDRSSSIDEDDDDEKLHAPSINHNNNNEDKNSSPGGGRSTSLTLSEARRRRKEEKLRQEQHQQYPELDQVSPTLRRDPHYTPYDDTPPRNLRGLKTPTLYEDPSSSSIAFVNAKNHTGTAGTTDQFYYPHKNENPNTSNRTPKRRTTSATTTTPKKTLSNHPQQRQADDKKTKRRNNQNDDAHDDVNISLEDYGETPEGGPQRYPDPEDGGLGDLQQRPPAAAFFIDLSDDLGLPSSSANHQQQQRQEKPSVLKNTIVKPNKSVPKPATFSKGLVANDRKNSTPKKSHVLIPQQKKNAHFAADDRDGAGADYYDYGDYDLDGTRFDAPIIANIDLTGNNNNNNKKNQRPLLGFSNPTSTLAAPSRNHQPRPASSIPTWIDLMNQKTQLESDHSAEFSDIARFRIEQERRNNTSGLDPRDYELLPNIGLDRALKQARQSQFTAHTDPTNISSSKLAGIPFSATNPTPAQAATAPIVGTRGPTTSKNNSPYRYGRQSNNTPDSVKMRVPSYAVPPAPRPSSTTSSKNGNNNNISNIHTPVENFGTQQDIRRHLDRLKLDTQEAVAKMRQSPVIQGLL